MSRPAYIWRQLTPEQRAEILDFRQRNQRPWHSPPRRPTEDGSQFHVTAACYEHRPHIGLSPDRIDQFTDALLAVFDGHASRTAAWCVLPNHYHALIETTDLKRLLWKLGRLHGRSSHAWNGEEDARGRQVFHSAVDRAIRSERHFWATVNYVHHNPVRHGYVALWTDWPWTSATDFLCGVGREEAERIWREYPVRDYGEGWDAPEL